MNEDEDDCSVQIFIIIRVYSLYLCIYLGLNPTCQTFLCQEICIDLFKMFTGHGIRHWTFIWSFNCLHNRNRLSQTLEI